MRVAYFYDDIDNLIERNNSTELYENIPAVASQGVETDIDLFPLDSLYLNLNYTYLSMKDKSTMRQEIQYRPKHKLSWTSYYTLPFDTKIELDGFFVGTQYYYNNDSTVKYRLGDYTVVNSRISHPLTGFLKAYVGVNNIFDESYEESFALPLAGRYFYGGIKLTY